MAHSPFAADCDECAHVLKDVHPDLVYWFTAKVKPMFPSMHVELGYRDAAAQKEARRKDESRFEFPHSPHNQTDPVDGAPSSTAIDLMQINDVGRRRYNSQDFLQLHALCLTAEFRVISDLDCREKGFYNHFELIPPLNHGPKGR